MLSIPCALGLGVAACASGDTATRHLPELRLEVVASGLSEPVFVTSPPGDARLFVVEKTGLIRIVRDGTTLGRPFLDLTAQVSRGSEQGLLSLAFAPDYASSGEFYVDYTDRSGDTRVVRYRVSADPDVADPATAQLVLLVEQPYSNHNGGLVLFGPDGMLYVGLGDGGSGGDPDENGQDRSTLLGSLLRIDVGVDTTYAIPEDNPFVGVTGARPEIWAYGLRNPWRFSFDRATGDLYIADVGQNAWEEVSVEPAGSGGGRNYGWDVLEGTHCYEPPSGCDRSGLVLPVIEYANGGGNCSVTGGYVYRGSAISALRGHYLYADFCSGLVRSFRYADGRAREARDWSDALATGGGVSSFGEDASGELYITTLGGTLYKVLPTAG